MSYNTLLERAGIVTLKDRRLGMVDRFVIKNAANPAYNRWFPTRSWSGHNLRQERIYEEKKAKTGRLYNSPLYFFRRRLNCI